MAQLIERVVSSGCVIGEAPLWVPEEQALYWTDTESYMIWSLRESDEGSEIRKWSISLPVTALMRRENGRFILVTKTGPAVWDPTSNTCELIANPLVEHPELSFNDGAVDRQGRLVTGTMNHVDHIREDGNLYQLDEHFTLKLMDSGLSVANGISFSPEGDTLYVSEQFKGRILAYDYDSDRGTLKHKRIFAEVPQEEGLPDGLVVDAEGYVWNARWGGGRIVRFSPEGRKVHEIIMPVPITACLAFGGESFHDIYVTTGCYGMDEAEKRKYPGSGDLYRIRDSFAGVIEPRFRG